MLTYTQKDICCRTSDVAASVTSACDVFNCTDASVSHAICGSYWKTGSVLEHKNTNRANGWSCNTVCLAPLCPLSVAADGRVSCTFSSLYSSPRHTFKSAFLFIIQTRPIFVSSACFLLWTSTVACRNTFWKVKFVNEQNEWISKMLILEFFKDLLDRNHVMTLLTSKKADKIMINDGISDECCV